VTFRFHYWRFRGRIVITTQIWRVTTGGSVLVLQSVWKGKRELFYVRP
jgi:hypothetical protein